MRIARFRSSSVAPAALALSLASQAILAKPTAPAAPVTTTVAEEEGAHRAAPPAAVPKPRIETHT